MPEFNPESGFLLGDWEVHPALNRIADGTRTRALEGKVMAVLVALAQTPGSVVSKRAILDAVWPHQSVAEGVLTRAVHELRTALGDDAQHPRYVDTVPRKGYRLIATVSRLPVATDQPRKRRPEWGAMAIAVSVLVGALLWRVSIDDGRTSSVAVLPLANLTGDTEKDFLGRGLSEEIIHIVAQQPEIKVTARTSSFTLNDENLTVEEIAERLGVGYVIEGSVREERGVQRITVQLIHATSGSHVGSASIDVIGGDLFSARNRLGQEVEKLLRTAELPVSSPAGEPPAAVSPRAYELFLKGRAALHVRSAESLREARVFFEEALAIDPEFALAHAGLAQFYLVSGAYLRADYGRSRSLAAEASKHALDLDNENVDALMVTAAVLADRGDYTQSVRRFQEAVALEPNNAQAHQWYGETLATLGYVRAARESIALALELNPLAGSTNSVRAKAAAFFSDDDELLSSAEQGHAMGALLASRLLALHYFRAGNRANFERYIKHYHSVVGVDPSASGYLGAAMAGELPRDALIEALAPVAEPRDNYFARELALLGLAEAALDAIRRGAASHGGHLSDIWLPEFGQSRRLPEFSEFIGTLGLDTHWQELGLPDACQQPRSEEFCRRLSATH